jgi:hypothetical protein
MVTVARRIDMAPQAASFAVSFPTPIRALIMSCSAYTRPRLHEALVTASAAIIVYVAIMMPTQPTSNPMHLHKPLAQRAAAIKNFQLASHPYIECLLASAARLAFQSEIPELVAIAAIKQCAEMAKHLRELAIPIAGEGGSLAIMSDVNDLLREHARSVVVAIREESERRAVHR